MKTFNITIDMLNAKGACMSGMRDFLDKYPESEYPQGVDYQELLDACAAADRDDYGSWLLDRIGRTNAVLEVDEINSEKSIFFAGRFARRKNRLRKSIPPHYADSRRGNPRRLSVCFCVVCVFLCVLVAAVRRCYLSFIGT